MADDNTPPTDPTKVPPAPPAEPDPPATGDDTDKTDPPKPGDGVPPEMKAALHKANKEAETLRLKLKEFEDRDKTDLEKLAERATASEKRAVDAESRALRAEVASTLSVPADLVEFLTGTTEEELTAQAAKLVAHRAGQDAADAEPRTPRPDPAQGARPDGTASLQQRIADALAAGDVKTSMRLKSQQLLASTT
jgi:hypothetical protein